ncbi:MAG TPA: hypothetical protein VFN35_28505, partial [Ktedonobacteraceae bacterium]|nr:hypothetical protein [Ktedonobacteraceae bacterium]
MRKQRVPWIIACSLHTYRWLLTLTPDEFANVYSEPALHVFRQCCQDAYDKQGTRGVLNLWLPTFSDALYGIIAEQGSSLKKIFSPNLLWPAVLALGVVLFPFSWLSNTWQPFGSFFQLFFATPQDYFVGHVLLF